MLDYPWPLSDRELIMHVTGVSDYKNKAIMTLSKFKNVGTNYFDYVSPQENPKFPREQVDSLYYYFQYISPTQSRFIAFSRSNAQFDFIPTWFFNHVTSTVVNAFLKILQKFALRLANPADPLFIYYDRKKPTYDSFLVHVL